MHSFLRPHVLTSFGLFLLITGSYLVLAIHYPVAYIWATYEDMYGEWTQLFLFLTTMAGAIWLTIRGNHRYHLFFALLAVACFYTVMEEISWGQRLFGFDSPYLFEEHNLQSETNLHNFLAGPSGGALKQIVEYSLALALLTYGLVYPLLLKAGWYLATRVQSLGILAPPLYLWPFFAMASCLEIGFFDFNEAEIAEILVGTGLLIMVLHCIITCPHASHKDRQLDTSQSRQLALAIIASFMAVVSLAVATTQLIYSDPIMKIRIDNRIDNGFMKFAFRFENRGEWEKAAAMYQQALVSRPNNQNVLRNLARNYRLAGNEEKYKEYNTLLQQYAEKKFSSRTNSVRVALSFSYSFGRSGDMEKSNMYALLALENAKRDAINNPKSADAAYWLAVTNDHLNKYTEGLLHYQRAHELDPDSAKYKRALDDSKRRQTSQRGNH